MAKPILKIICVCIFAGGILLAIFGRAMCVRDTQDYQQLQPELFAPDEIAEVLYHEELEQLYVCYNDASYVNVYTSGGEFLWAVSTPYLRNAYFSLTKEELIIYNDQAYIYNSRDGSYIGVQSADSLDLDYDWQDEVTDNYVAGEYYFDTYQVYQGQSDGTLNTIVSRPAWYIIFHFVTGWIIACVGAVGFCILTVFEKTHGYRAVRKTIKLQDKTLRGIQRYYQITVAIQLGYTVVNIIGAFFTGIFILGIFLLAIHFIISSIVLENRLDRFHLTKDENKVFEFWNAMKWASFLAAFLSVGIVALLLS